MFASKGAKANKPSNTAAFVLPREWFSLPENADKRKKFDISMATHARLHPPEALVKGTFLVPSFLEFRGNDERLN